LARYLSLAEYVFPTVKRREAKDERSGTGAGIAKKSGNAGGVKAPAAVDRRWTNISYTQR
jgi:hypothetical protein